ncbi:MAG: NfeD family protein [Actinomycetota bacterium]
MALIIGGTLAYLFLPYPWWVVAIVGLAAWEVLEAALVVWFWKRFKTRKPTVGIESLEGEEGVLMTPGRIRIRGTSYPARAADAEPGDRVIVERLDGMTLVVRRLDAQR